MPKYICWNNNCWRFTDGDIEKCIEGCNPVFDKDIEAYEKEQGLSVLEGISCGAEIEEKLLIAYRCGYDSGQDACHGYSGDSKDNAQKWLRAAKQDGII